MPLPNFIIFGAVKSGTGALHQYLSHHPEIFTSPLKEPRFFVNDASISPHDREAAHSTSITSLEEYSQCFDGATHEKAIGEASSNYIYSGRAARRIKEVIPQVRLIASLRNPVDRAYAHYMMLKASRKKAVSEILTDGRNESWAACSLYHEKLKPYFDIFRRDQVKVVIFEEWVVNTAEALKEIYQFLGVDDSFEIASHIRYRPGVVTWPMARKVGWVQEIKPYIPTRVLMTLNAIKAKVSPERHRLSPEARREMVSWYHDDILKLQDLLHRDLSVWLEDG